MYKETDPVKSVKCYISTMCPFAQRTRITILAKQIPHEFIDLGNDWLLDPSKKPQVLKEKNPLYGAVPVIEHHHLVLYESSVVNQYLEDQFPNYGDVLMPQSDAKLKAWARLLMSDCDKKFVSTFYHYLMNKDESKEQEFRDQFIKQLQLLEERFKMCPGAYFLGKSLTLVDISYVTIFERIVDVLLVRKQEDLLSKNAPLLDEWYNTTMQNVEAFQLTKTDSQKLLQFYDKYIEAHSGEASIA